MNPKIPELRQQALRRALTPEKRLPSNFAHQTMKRIAVEQEAAERRRQRWAAVAAAVVVSAALGILGWMFGPACAESLRASLPDAASLAPWLPVSLAFALLLVFDAWLSRRRRGHRP